jgi:hypothetical protein
MARKTRPVSSVSIVPVDSAPVDASNIADLPTPTYDRAVPIELVYSADNVRENVSFTSSAALQVLSSLCVNGQLPGHPFIGNRGPDGRIKVLVGNRRITFMHAINDGPARIDGLLKDVDPKARMLIKGEPGKFKTVEMLVYDGLDEAQEAVIRNDHAGVEPLTSWDKYTQLVQLWRAGLTSRQIESSTGVSHGSAEKARNIYVMGPDVEAEFHAQCHKEEGYGLRTEDRMSLYSAWLQDVSNGTNLPISARSEEARTARMANAESCYFRSLGPLSSAKWESLKERYFASKAGRDADEETPKKRRTTKQHMDNADNFRDVPWVADYAKWAAGDTSINVGEVYKAAKAFMAEGRRVAAENDALRMEIAKLRTDLAEASEIIRQYKIELDSAEERLREYEGPPKGLDGPTMEPVTGEVIN